MKKKELGRLGENIAAAYLKENGCRILEMNFTAKYGEIDIIAQEKNTLLFVEVKTRKNSLYGTAAQAVNYKKQRKIILTASAYMSLHENTVSNCRFDIIEIYYNNSSSYKVNHLKGAFEL